MIWSGLLSLGLLQVYNHVMFLWSCNEISSSFLHGTGRVDLFQGFVYSHSTKSDIHGIMMKTLDEWENLPSGKIQSAPNSGKKVIQSSYKP